MSIFCYKKIPSPIRLGERLVRRRLELELSLAQAAARAQIQLKYAKALEQSAFQELPKAKAYRLAYLKEYAVALDLPPNECLKQFTAEEGLADITVRHPHRTIKFFPAASIFIRNGILAGLVALFAGYLGWQVKGILQPPRLMVYSPLEGMVTKERAALVQGEAEREARLLVNGQEIIVSERGTFEAKIDLSEGLNTITILATKRHGKTSTVIRHLVVRPQQKPVPISLK